MKLTLRRVVIFLLILAVSVGFGFAFDGIATLVEKHQYPMDSYAELIAEAAENNGIPQVILWAVIRTESGFVSNAVSEDGSIGLMQLTPEEFSMIGADILNKNDDAELLYAPKTNLQYGAAYLSHLYQRYGVWETVLAAYDAGTKTVDAWLQNPEYVTELGTLAYIPNASTASFVSEVNEAITMYTKLYF
ncbi:MAG: lytic transglycosylase domain-containing protein [Clostridia bacterium]|nr:lytic transglycosylase domain-containing protein [Clostridia bacterium]